MQIFINTYGTYLDEKSEAILKLREKINQVEGKEVSLVANTKSMVYDFIEPYRIFAERFVFKLFTSKRINKSYFEHFTGGVSIHRISRCLLIDSQKK